MTKIICSHGFGVDATGRGLFTDIAAALPEHEFTMFDYNELDNAGNMTVQALPTQTQLLNQYVQDAGEEVVLLCHSLGCVVAASANLDNVSKLIFMAPPGSLNLGQFVGIFGNREGAEYNPEGVSSMPRADGTTTYIGKDFLESIATLNIIECFQTAANKRNITIIRAEQDELVGQTSFDNVKAQVLTLPGSHNFDGKARKLLIASLKELLH